MDALLELKPGLLIWSIINFLVFLFIFIKIGYKPIKQSMKAREDKINTSIENADKANKKAQELLEESQNKLDNAQKEMSEIVNNGKKQAESHIQKAKDEADKIKKDKLDEAIKQIEMSKQNAINELRNEVADLVIMTTEKLLEEKLDASKDKKLIESYIDKLPNN